MNNIQIQHVKYRKTKEAFEERDTYSLKN